ncbi:hypothetical protein ACFLX5_01765 [Chloroflexota bacterium]
MVFIFGLILGIAFTIFGIACYLLAEKVRLNPALGFSFEFVTHEVWCRSNRAGGIEMAIIGLVIIIITSSLWALDAPNGPSLLGIGLTAAVLTALGEIWIRSYIKRLTKEIQR